MMRVEEGSAFNHRFFDNPMLWWCLSVVLRLQITVVNWAPAQELFNVTSVSLCANLGSEYYVQSEAFSSLAKAVALLVGLQQVSTAAAADQLSSLTTNVVDAHQFYKKASARFISSSSPGSFGFRGLPG